MLGFIDKNNDNFEFLNHNEKIVFFNLSQKSKINLINKDPTKFDLIFTEKNQADFQMFDELTQQKIVQTNPSNFKYVAPEKQEQFLKLLNPETQEIVRRLGFEERGDNSN